eukprot:187462-Chlamydomonas_euryale.AAC.1
MGGLKGTDDRMGGLNDTDDRIVGLKGTDDRMRGLQTDEPDRIGQVGGWTSRYIVWTRRIRLYVLKDD